MSYGSNKLPAVRKHRHDVTRGRVIGVDNCLIEYIDSFRDYKISFSSYRLRLIFSCNGGVGVAC